MHPLPQIVRTGFALPFSLALLAFATLANSTGGGQVLDLTTLATTRGADGGSYVDQYFTCNDLNLPTPDPNAVSSLNCVAAGNTCIYCQGGPVGNTTMFFGSGSSQYQFQSFCSGPRFQATCVADATAPSGFSCDLANGVQNGSCDHTITYTTKQSSFY